MVAHAQNSLKLIPETIAVAIRDGYHLFTRWRSRRETYLRLMSLDDRLLHDIGLTRADVWSAANGDFRETAANTNSPAQDAA